MGGKYQVYPEYKDSGVEWLGEIPKDWKCLKLKYVADLKGDKVEAGSLHRYVGMENVQSGNGKFITTDEKTPEGLSTSFSEGDVLFGKLRPYLAKSWLADFSGICSSEFLILRSHKVCSKFLNYYTLTEEFVTQVNSSTYGSKMPRASWDFISLMGTPVPPANLSERIVNFLDHETAKIDTLIEEQQSLIRLLKEKRQAVISHAVTKGLPSITGADAPMKDSGVEWLGEVPEHWVVMQFRRITNLSQGLQIPQSDRLTERVDNSIEYITVKSINAGSTAEHREYIYKPSDRVVCNTNDVLLARTGATGQVITNVEGAFHNNFFKVEYSNLISKDYLVNLLLVNELKSHLLMLAGTTTIPDLNHGAFLGTKIALPDLDEQVLINKYVENVNNQYSRLLNTAGEQIKLLQERRTALISAAVTGKIDVRNWVAPTTEPENAIRHSGTSAIPVSRQEQAVEDM